jgi:hypothetical protein
MLLLLNKKESQTDSHPLLMDHVIGIRRDGAASSSTSCQDNHDGLDYLPQVSDSPSGTTTASNSQNAPQARNDNRGHRQQSPLNSGFWISVELVMNLSQIIAAICVLSVSRNEHPYAPLFEWVIGYTVGCIATLPHLWWRYINRNHLTPGQESARQNFLPNNNPESNSYTGVSAPPVSEAGGVSGTNRVSRNSLLTNPR